MRGTSIEWMNKRKAEGRSRWRGDEEEERALLRKRERERIGL